MPSRIIRESARTSATLYQLSDGAERLFWRLILVADDHGRFEADPRIVKANCFPLWGDTMKVEKISRWLDELGACDLTQFYTVNGKTYGVFVTWTRHQRKRLTHPKYPDPPVGGKLPQVAASCGELRPELRVESRELRGESRDTTGSFPAEREPTPPPPKKAPEWGTPEALVELYNRLIPPGHPRATKLTPGRRAKSKRYLVDFPEQSFWVGVFSEIKLSSFLTNGSRGSPHFRGDFDWMLTKGQNGTENCVKVQEGKFRDREGPG